MGQDASHAQNMYSVPSYLPTPTPVPPEISSNGADPQGIDSSGEEYKSAEELRDIARQWAVRDSFSEAQLAELDQLMSLVSSTYIPSGKVSQSREFDRGAFGKIYTAKYDGGDVAVKQMVNDAGKSSIKNKMRELLLELSVLVRIRHPNIVTFWGTLCSFPDATNPGRQPYFGMVFELCPRKSLHNALYDEPRGTLNSEMKTRIAVQIAYGIAYLHSKRADDHRSIIHRDINTRNILLTSDMTPKICDFGCARVVGSNGKLSTTTISGSPPYMAPEQLRGDSLSEAVDVWAFSVVLWEMIAERIPWHPIHQDMNALKDAIITRRQRLPIPQGHSVSDKYINCIIAGTQLNPEDRPRMIQMAKELQRT